MDTLWPWYQAVVKSVQVEVHVAASNSLLLVSVCLSLDPRPLLLLCMASVGPHCSTWGSRMLVPQDNQSYPRNLWMWPCVLNSLAGVIKWRILRYRDLSGFSRWAQHNHKSSCWRETSRLEKKEGGLVTVQEVAVRWRRGHETELSHRSRGVWEIFFLSSL